MEHSRKLYALCIGINNYRFHKILSLYGCVSDANKVYQYLEELCDDNDIEFDGVLLTNKKATKSRIVKTFREHFENASKNDIAVLYFSGHGSEESPHQAFKTGNNKNISTLICHDSRYNNKSDLADKEISYLISKTFKEDNMPHLLFITDSCHSGGVTRAIVKEGKPKAIENGKTRAWEDFIFQEELSEIDFINSTSFSDILPERPHIHLSACQDNEYSLEINDRKKDESFGLFTSTLMKVLHRSLQVTYEELIARTRYAIKQTYDQIQTPTLRVVSSEANKLHHSVFLNYSNKKHKILVNIVYNEKLGWLMDIGAIHGLEDQSQLGPISIVDSSKKEITKALIDRILPDYTILKQCEYLDKKEIYYTDFQHKFRKTKFTLVPNNKDTKRLANIFDLEKNMLQNKGIEISTVNNADYQIEIQNEDSYIIKSYAINKVLIQPIPISHPESLDLLKAQLEKITKWNHIRQLTNIQTQLISKQPNTPPVSILIYKVNDENDSLKDSLINKGTDNYITINKTDNFRVAVKNNLEIPIYCSLLGLNNSFGIDTYLTTERVIRLEPSEQYFALDYEVYKGSDIIEEYQKEDQWTNASFCFKAIINTTRFDVTYLQQEGLKSPKDVFDESSKQNLYSTSYFTTTNTEETRNTQSIVDWTTSTLKLKVNL